MSIMQLFGRKRKADSQPVTSEVPAVKRVKPDYAKAIRVLVGTDEHECMSFEDVMVQYSKFFQEVLGNSGFKEAKAKTVRAPGVDITVRVPEIDIETFKTCIHWCHKQEIAIMTPEEIAQDEDGHTRMQIAVEVYIGALTLDILPLRNACVDYLQEISDATRYVPTFATARRAYDAAAAKSLLCKLIACQYAKLCPEDAKRLKEANSELPPDLVRDIAYELAMMRHEKTDEGDGPEKCKFHEHDEEYPECAT